MAVFDFFSWLFSNIVDFMSKPIDLGGGITVSFFGLFVATALFGVLIMVLRNLYD